jgi:hypothetical protein
MTMNHPSNFTQELHAYAEQAGCGLTTLSSDVIDGYVIDIADPASRVAINLVPLNGIESPDNRLLEMSMKAHENNFTLYHVFESDWMHRRSVLMKKIDSLLGIGSEEKTIYRSKKCEIRRIDEKTFREFFRTNSVAVTSKADKYFGMYPIDKQDTTLVAAIAVKNLKKDPNGSIITSYVTNLDHKVVGAFGKFVGYLKGGKNYCLYHADLRWLDLRSTFLNKASMKFVKVSEPLRFAYTQSIKKLHLLNGMTRESLSSRVSLSKPYDTRLSIEDNLAANDFSFIRDAGCMIFSSKKN